MLGCCRSLYQVIQFSPDFSPRVVDQLLSPEAMGAQQSTEAPGSRAALQNEGGGGAPLSTDAAGAQSCTGGLRGSSTDWSEERLEAVYIKQINASTSGMRGQQSIDRKF